MGVLFTKLDEEWAMLGGLRRTRRAIEAWGQTEEVLAGFANGHDLITAIRAGGRPGNDLLAALVRRAPHDELAGRAVLQALLPALVILAWSLRWSGDEEDIEAEVVAKAWQLVRTYPLSRRPGQIAANLALDTRKLTIRARLEELTCVDPGDLPEVVAIESRSAGEEIVELVIEALLSGAMSHEDAQVVLALRLGLMGAAAIADQTGTTPGGVRQHRRRAEERLGRSARPRVTDR